MRIQLHRWCSNQTTVTQVVFKSNYCDTGSVQIKLQLHRWCLNQTTVTQVVFKSNYSYTGGVQISIQLHRWCSNQTTVTQVVFKSNYSYTVRVQIKLQLHRCCSNQTTVTQVVLTFNHWLFAANTRSFREVCVSAATDSIAKTWGPLLSYIWYLHSEGCENVMPTGGIPNCIKGNRRWLLLILFYRNCQIFFRTHNLSRKRQRWYHSAMESQVTERIEIDPNSRFSYFSDSLNSLKLTEFLSHSGKTQMSSLRTAMYVGTVHHMECNLYVLTSASKCTVGLWLKGFLSPLHAEAKTKHLFKYLLNF